MIKADHVLNSSGQSVTVIFILLSVVCPCRFSVRFSISSSKHLLKQEKKADMQAPFCTERRKENEGGMPRLCTG